VDGKTVLCGRCRVGNNCIQDFFLESLKVESIWKIGVYGRIILKLILKKLCGYVLDLSIRSSGRPWKLIMYIGVS
jgi:hypothetical protein